MVRYWGRLDRREFLIAAGWRIGLFIGVTIAYPYILLGILRASSCAGTGGACGALALVVSLFARPLIFLVFLLLIAPVSVRRARDAGMPALLGLLIPLLFLGDWQFAITVASPWTVGFVLGAMGGWPVYFGAALACVAFLCCIPSAAEDGFDGPRERFGTVGMITLGLAAVLSLSALMKLVTYGTMVVVISRGNAVPSLPMFTIMFSLHNLALWLFPVFIVMLGVVIGQRRSVGTSGPAAPTGKLPSPPPVGSRAAFGRRGA
jgi:uncharacterized membrane protein YhaH (DUF805 family)